MEKRGISKQVLSGYAKVKNYATDIEKYTKEGTEMILKGPVGTMKILFAVAVLQEYIKFGGSVLSLNLVKQSFLFP